ncbi:MAG: universal stress protein [Bdellovibrionota bacterium]
MKILWAVDAFQQSDEILDRCAQAIRLLMDSKKIEIDPVFVLPPEQINTPFEVLFPPFNLSYGEDAEKIFKQKLEHISLPGLLAPRVLDKPILSSSGEVRVLVEDAAEHGADLIVVGTHGRKGVGRLFLGSFAESLLLHSSIPVLMVPLGADSPRKYDPILFPTDFGSQSEVAFPNVLALAKDLGSKLLLFHRIPRPRLMPLDPLRFDTERAKRQNISTAYIEKARELGVEIQVIIEASGDSASQAILELAQKERAGLIAMAAQSGAVASTIAGSTTRQVVRESPCPVWVLHAAKVARAIKEKAA